MANSLKTMWSAIAVSLVTVASVNAAFYDDQSSPTYCPCPPSRPFLDPCGNFYINAEGLYWEASQEGLNFATKKEFKCSSESSSSSSSSSDLPGPSSSVSSESSLAKCDVREHGSVKDLRSSWDGGFRVGIGYDLPYDGWDVVAKWTWFKTKAKNHTDAAPGEVIFAARGDLNGSTITHVDADWRLNLNILDVELGREFSVSPSLSLRPFLGIRAAWVDQKYNTVNRGNANIDLVVNNETINVAVDSYEDIRMKSKFSGCGVRAGLDSEWKVGYGFSVYGNAAGSILWGHFDRYTTVYNGVSASGTVTNEVQAEINKQETICQSQEDKKSHSGCRAITDAALGVRWKQFFDCDRIALTLSLGWEHHCFFDQNRFEEIASVAKPNPREQRGDLYTQGVTFTARLDF